MSREGSFAYRVRVRGLGVEVEDRQTPRSAELRQLAGRKPERNIAVHDHCGHALDGVARIEGHVGRAGLQHGEDGDDDQRIVGQADRDPPSRADAKGL